MPRILGIDIPKDRPIYISLTHIYGIGITTSKKILDEAGVEYSVRGKDISEAELAAITVAIKKGNYLLEGDLRRDIAANIKRLITAGAYRGSRHKKGLPCRGQRSKTNARTRKGPRKAAVKSRNLSTAKK